MKDMFKIKNPFIQKKVSVAHTKKFHKKKHLIGKIILSQTEKHEIIHGEQAIKKQTPKYLHRPTTDYDIYTPTPLEDARQTERALDRRFGGDFFRVEHGQHIGTVRVIANANEQSYADYTKPEGKIPFKTIDNKNYATLGFMKSKAKEITNNPFSSYRHPKDIDTINRIKITERRTK